MNRPDSELGYRGIKGPIECTFKLRKEEDVLRQGIYTLNKYGFRVTPNTNKNGERLLFFGGSYMVGELVNDNETLPYYVSEKLQHRFNVLNLGWSGWGPHQMLRMIEAGLLNDFVQGSIRGAVLKTAIWHTQRVLGYSSWDQRGPKYQRQANGDIKFVGPFKTDGRINFEKGLKHSRLLAWILRGTPKIAPSDVELYIDIIVKSSTLLQEQYGAPLLILYWDSSEEIEKYGGYTPESVIQQLRQRGLTVLRASDVINFNDPMLRIIGDGHPLPTAYNLEAQMVSSFIQQNPKTIN